MKYPLYNLDEKRFEKLVAMICQEILGLGTIVFTSGKDGGRDAKFTGTAQQFPDSKNPWTGKFIIQAKFTENPVASCSDSTFSTILNDELPKVQKLKEGGFVDYYLLFTNRKLTGLRDPILEKRIDEEAEVESRVLGLDSIHLFLEQNPVVAKRMELSKLLMPLEFYEEDLRNLIITFSSTDIKSINRHPSDDFTLIPKDEKNRLNNLTADYYNNYLKRSVADFGKIDSFLNDPQNDDLKRKYDNTVSDIQGEILAHRDKYETFDHIFHHLAKLINESSNSDLMRDRRLVPVFLHYMYFCCDIGLKEGENA